jgi:hypothetical protein
MPTGMYIRTKDMYTSRANRVPWNKGMIGIYSKETQVRMSLSHKGKPSPRKGVHLSAETRKKLSIAHKGQHAWNKGLKGIHLSPESEFKKGVINVKAIETRKRLYAEGKIAPWNKGKKGIFSDSTIEKMRIAKLGRPLSEGHRAKIRSSLIGGNSKSFKNGHVSWNTNKKGIHLSPSSEFEKGANPWNKGKPSSQIAWNKGKTGIFSEETLRKIGMASKGRYPTWETRQKMIQARSRIVIPYKDTKIEVILQNALNTLGIEFRKHVPIRLSDKTYHQVDIFIDPNICIEADGDYWHSRPKTKVRDEFINKELNSMHYLLYRFTESEIRAK